jgi:hypothetical protein
MLLCQNNSFVHPPTESLKAQLNTKLHTMFTRNGALLSYRGLVLNPTLNEPLSASIHSNSNGLKHSRETNRIWCVENSNTHIVWDSWVNNPTLSTVLVCFQLPICLLSASGGSKWISGLALDPPFAGSSPADDDGVLRAIKIRSSTSFEGVVKSSTTRRKILQHVKDTCGVWKRYFTGKING